MLDDLNVINQRDCDKALDVAALQYKQAEYIPKIVNQDHDNRPLQNIVIAGMGGSALAALILKTWLSPELSIPIEVVRSYDLPNYVGANSLVIVSSYSGNTEEEMSCLKESIARGSQIAIVSAGGEVIEVANSKQIAFTLVPGGIQPRMTLIYQLRALVMLLINFRLVTTDKFNEIARQSNFLKNESEKWLSDKPTELNYAKQLAQEAVGKIGMFYGGPITATLAYKWKISWNENAKNLAFCNELPEFNHNEFMGWTSHPIEKPFAVFDIVSKSENPRILKRFEISDRLLSGKRPKSTIINLEGDSIIGQLLWGCILADFTSIYVAILNGINPTPVPLVEKLKQELAELS